MPTDAALNPTARMTRPLIVIARSSPLPAILVVSPSAAYRPVPIIIAAVKSVALVGPSVRFNDDVDFSDPRFASLFKVAPPRYYHGTTLPWTHSSRCVKT